MYCPWKILRIYIICIQFWGCKLSLEDLKVCYCWRSCVIHRKSWYFHKSLHKFRSFNSWQSIWRLNKFQIFCIKVLKIFSYFFLISDQIIIISVNTIIYTQMFIPNKHFYLEFQSPFFFKYFKFPKKETLRVSIICRF